jgi:hypothetical protein
MNLKTTLVLLILVVAGGVFFWLGPNLSSVLPFVPGRPEVSDHGTLSVLEKDLTPERLIKIEIQADGRRVVVERPPDGEWTLPGKWPTRKAEVAELVGLIGNLRSRFTPQVLDPDPTPEDLKEFGLDQPPVTVTVWAGDKHRLAFGEEQRESNRFSRATFLRMDDKPEVVRLAPGLVALLSHPQDYYQQRRLFPSERIAKEGDSQEKVERLTAKAVTVKGGDGSYTLTQAGDEWELREPVRDHTDPDKLKTILAAVPDIWAEQFVDKPKADLAEYGLKEPKESLTVTRPSGDTVTLLIGKQSKMKTRTVTKPAPAFGGPGMPPQREVVHEEYRFAKLQDNNQIFEIKADKLKDIFVAANTLRDPRVARFFADNARRVVVKQGPQEMVLAKEKDQWRLQKPLEAEADSSKVSDLLIKLSNLEAKDKDVLDKADPKSHGLDKPAATVEVTVEEEKGTGDAKTKKTRTVAYDLGKHDAEKSKLYVRVEGWDRINAVDDGLWKLIEQPALAYRSKKVFDFASSELAKIEVRRSSETVTLEQAKDAWRLTTPTPAEVDSSKVTQLTGDLSRLDAVEYVAEKPAAEALDQQYGLTKPALTATVTFMDAKKPAQKLLIGKQRPDKPEYFAKLESAPGVFVVKKDIHDALDRDSLSYRPLQLWQMKPTDVEELRIQKTEPEYRLKRAVLDWKITGPFEALAATELARPMVDEMAAVKCERYAAHEAKDLATYGLDKPYLRVVVQERVKEDAGAEKPADPAKPADKDKPIFKERVLLIGKTTDKDAKTRYAKLGDNPAIFVVGEKMVATLDHTALDLLDRKLLALDAKSIERIHSQGTGGTLTLQRQGETWQVVESPVDPFPADSEVSKSVLGVWANLRAQRFAAYGPKVDWALYGLDKPTLTTTVTVKPPADDGKPAKPTQHTLILGKAVEGSAGERYARLDTGPGVAVLASTQVSELTRGYLEFVNRTVLRLDAGSITAIQRKMGNDLLELVKQDRDWYLNKPVGLRADGPTLEGLLDQLATLRAKRVAAYPAKDLPSYRLDNPEAVVTLRQAAPDGKPAEHVIKIGKTTGEATAPDDRFAVVDNSTAVVVLPGTLARRLLAAPLQFRDHNLARFTDADRLTLERGPRKAVFAKVDGNWKLTEPLVTEAEQTDLEEFINSVARLRADELVADKPADLKVYGLDRPEARWRVQSGDKEVLQLLIGGREKIKEQGKETEGPRCYAKLATGDLVFLLDPSLTTKVLAEYRNRTPWSPVDAAQVERLSYGYARNPFVLEKVGNDWQVAGKPEIKVKPEAVRETLDALASLKVGRYVVDKGADLKLYGLEPPQLVLEIQLPTSKRILHVGRQEGESKRYYARVMEGSNTAVFVITEADAERIVRTLPMLTQGASKAGSSTP